MNEPIRESLQKLAEIWIEEGWQKGNVSVVDELHAPSFVDHDSAGRPSNRKGFKQGIADLYKAFPDLHCVVEDLVIDTCSHKVAVRWSGVGTHHGPFLSFQPTGRTIRFRGIEIIRVQDGLIAERWGEWDGMDILEQLQQAAQHCTDSPE
jgi:steroid delta-isomerase-like uncharacterized protein